MNSQPDPNQLLQMKFQSFLESRHLKFTRSRKIILEYFLNLGSGTHQNVESIYKNLSAQGFKIGMATIYRTIHLMTECGILEQHAFQQSSGVYEVNYPHMHHDHLVCLDCGLIKEFEDLEIENRQLSIAKKLGFKLQSHKLELFGKCLTPHCIHLKNQNS